MIILKCKSYCITALFKISQWLPTSFRMKATDFTVPHKPCTYYPPHLTLLPLLMARSTILTPPPPATPGPVTLYCPLLASLISSAVTAASF